MHRAQGASLRFGLAGRPANGVAFVVRIGQNFMP